MRPTNILLPFNKLLNLNDFIWSKIMNLIKIFKKIFFFILLLNIVSTGACSIGACSTENCVSCLRKFYEEEPDRFMNFYVFEGWTDSTNLGAKILSWITAFVGLQHLEGNYRRDYLDMILYFAPPWNEKKIFYEDKPMSVPSAFFDMRENLLFELSLTEFSLITEFFLASAVLISIVYYSLIVYSKLYKKRNLTQFSGTSISILILFFTFLLISKDFFISTKYFSMDFSFLNDSLGNFAKIVTVVLSLVCVYFTKNFLTRSKINYIEYDLLTLFAILGLLLIATANDFITIFLGLELQGLAIYVLVGIKRNSINSVNSGLKYIIIASLSTAYYLLGSSLLFGMSGLLVLSQFHYFISGTHSVGAFFNNDYDFYAWVFEGTENLIKFSDAEVEPTEEEISLCARFFIWLVYEKGSWTKETNVLLPIFYSALKKYCEEEINHFFYKNKIFTLMSFSLNFILISFFFKLAGAPFHLWSLDIYEESPTSSTIFFAVVTKFSIIVILAKIYYYGFYDVLKRVLYQYIMFVSILSIFIGAVAGLREQKLKSLLAYSSINNVGYLLLTLAIGTVNSIKATFFYLIVYINSSVATWSGIISIQIKKNRYIKKQNKDFADLVLIRKNNPMITVLLHTALFSTAGLPPFIGFLTKMNLFLASIESHIFLISLITILLSIISSFYYLRLIKITCFEKVIIGKLHQTIKINQSNVSNVLGLFLFYQFLKPSLTVFFSYKIIIC